LPPFHSLGSGCFQTNLPVTSSPPQDRAGGDLPGDLHGVHVRGDLGQVVGAEDDVRGNSSMKRSALSTLKGSPAAVMRVISCAGLVEPDHGQLVEGGVDVELSTLLARWWSTDHLRWAPHSAYDRRSLGPWVGDALDLVDVEAQAVVGGGEDRVVLVALGQLPEVLGRL
jgi:hypothetical protein